MSNLIDGYYHYEKQYTKKDGTITIIRFRTKQREKNEEPKKIGRKCRVFTDEEKADICKTFNDMNRNYTYTRLYLKTKGFNISIYHLKKVLLESEF